MESGYSGDDSFICEECNEANEAKRIAKHFEAISDSIENQIGEQRGG